VAATSSDTSALSTTSMNVAGIDLALLVDQLTRTGSSPEMTATILSTLVATSPDAGPEEQKQILQKLTEALRERQRQIGLQKLAALDGSSSVSSSSTVTTVSTIVASLSQPVVKAPPQASSLPSAVVTDASVDKQPEHKPVVIPTKEQAAQPNKSTFSKTTTTVPFPAPSATAAAEVPSTQQWISSIPLSSSATVSSVNLSTSSPLSDTLATTSAAVVQPPSTSASALPPAIQHLLSGQSFENLKNILANVTGRKTGGAGVLDQSTVVSSGPMTRTHETLDSYTTSKGSRSDLQKMVAESEVVSEKPAEQDELFVANIHGDVDYRVHPAVPSEPPKSTQPFSLGQPGWVGGNDQFQQPVSSTSQLAEGRHMAGVGTRSLLPGPFSQSSSIQSKNSGGGSLLAMPPHAGKTQALLPTPESSKPSEVRKENREERRQKPEDVVSDRDRPRYKDRRPFDERSSGRDDNQCRRNSRERSDVEPRSERRDGSRSTDRSFTRKAGSSSQGGSKEHSGSKVPRLEEGPIIIDDDCADIPLPPSTTASKTSVTSAPPAQTSTSVNQNFDVDRKVLLPTPAKVSTREKRKLDEPRRDQKFSRSWEHRSSQKSSTSSSKNVSETKGKKALLETPPPSGSVSESADAGYRVDPKDPRNSKRDSDSKSYERRRSRSRSRTRQIASNLLDRSRRKIGLPRHHRSSSRDRRRSSLSSSRPAVAHTAHRSRSRERAGVRSTSRDQLDEEEQRLRQQLDDLIARKNEGNRSKDNRFSPSYGEDQWREHSREMPPIFDTVPKSHSRAAADQLPHSRRHLLPAPPLPHPLPPPANMRGRVPLEPPALLRPPVVETGLLRPPIVDRNIGFRYSHPSDQPLIPSAAMLPGRPFIQEYSHKPAEAHTDQFRVGEVTDRITSRRDPEPGRPAFREEPGQHRYRPYPPPEDRHRMPPEPAERSRNWHVRDRQNEATVTSSKTSDFRGPPLLDRMSAGMEKVGSAVPSIPEHSSPAFSAVDQSSAMSQSTAVIAGSTIHTSVKSDLPVTGDGLLPLSSAPDSFSAEGSLPDKSGEQAAESTVAPENEVEHAASNIVPPPPCPPFMPVPPNFPAIVQHVRNMMFSRGPPRVPFNPMLGPRIRGVFRPPLPLPAFTVVPASAPDMRQDSSPMMMPMNRASAPLAGQSLDVSDPSKKPLLGDFPIGKQIPSLSVEVTTNAGPEMVQHQVEEMQNVEEAPDDDASASHLMAPTRFMETDQAHPNMPNLQLPFDSSVTGDKTSEADGSQAGKSAEQQKSDAIPPLMDFNMYRGRSSPKPSLFGPPPMITRATLPNFRPRMSMPVRARGLLAPRPGPPALLADVETRGGGGPAAFPRRGGPSFPPRTEPRYTS